MRHRDTPTRGQCPHEAAYTREPPRTNDRMNPVCERLQPLTPEGAASTTTTQCSTCQLLHCLRATRCNPAKQRAIGSAGRRSAQQWLAACRRRRGGTCTTPEACEEAIGQQTGRIEHVEAVAVRPSTPCVSRCTHNTQSLNARHRPTYEGAPARATVTPATAATANDILPFAVSPCMSSSTAGVGERKNNAGHRNRGGTQHCVAVAHREAIVRGRDTEHVHTPECHRCVHNKHNGCEAGVLPPTLQ